MYIRKCSISWTLRLSNIVKYSISSTTVSREPKILKEPFSATHYIRIQYIPNSRGIPRARLLSGLGLCSPRPGGIGHLHRNWLLVRLSCFFVNSRCLRDLDWLICIISIFVWLLMYEYTSFLCLRARLTNRRTNFQSSSTQHKNAVLYIPVRGQKELESLLPFSHVPPQHFHS